MIKRIAELNEDISKYEDRNEASLTYGKYKFKDVRELIQFIELNSCFNAY